MKSDGHHVDYVELGAGPTGMGAATRLHDKGVDWLMLEKESHFGGLSMSFKDDCGFTFDLGAMKRICVKGLWRDVVTRRRYSPLFTRRAW